MKKIYLIRHGQTEYNLKGIIQGSRVDTDLNETGLKQAEDFFEAYKTVPFDKIYTSKLKRTLQSVSKFIDLGIAHEAFEGLNEISWGEQDGVASNAQMHDYYVKVSKEWQSGNLDLPIGGGESPNEVATRQRPVIEHIISQKNEKTVLVCMHGRAIRILLCQLMKKSISEMDTFEHSNLCLYLLEYNGKDFTILKANDTSHIKA
jgi:probable phosphoglycerate mutase